MCGSRATTSLVHPEDIGQPIDRHRRSVDPRQAGGIRSTVGVATQELRIEDCTSDSSAEPAPWEDTMRLMPPLLELADMFNIILRRCRNSRADSDLVRGAPLQQLLICPSLKLQDDDVLVMAC